MISKWREGAYQTSFEGVVSWLRGIRARRGIRHARNRADPAPGSLARALYGDPFLVVLDEANSNLDAEGEAALTKAIQGVRARHGIVVVVAHRPSAIATVDLLLALKHGEAIAFGPKDRVLAKIVQNVKPLTPRLVASNESCVAG